MPTHYENDVSGSADMLDHRPDDWQAYANRGADQVRDMIRDHAGRSVFVALSAGLGVGLVIGSILGRSDRQSHWWDRSTAEGLGRRFLSKFGELSPGQISDRLGRK